MVQGVLELTNSLGINHYFVSVSKQENQLILHSLADNCKPLNKQIQLTEVDALTYQYAVSEAFISFNYQGEYYRFVDYGHPLFTFLKNILLFSHAF